MAAATLAAVAACHELPTELPPAGPRMAATKPSYNIACDPDCGQWDSPSSGSWNGTIDPWDGTGKGDSSAIGVFVYPTIVVVNVSGDVRQTPGILPGYDLTWGPTGTSDHQASIGLWVVSSTGSSIWWPRSGITTDTIKLAGRVYGLRSGLDDPQPEGGPTWTCGRYNHVPCWTYTGSAHVDFTRIDATLTLTRTKTGPVDSGTVEVFSVGSAPTTIAGNPVNISNVRWRWVPTKLATGDTLSCSSALTCSRVMRTPGTMYVSAYVNGVQKSAQMQVRVGRPKAPVCEIPEAPELSHFDMDLPLRELWDDSNYSPTTPDVDRREQGGFVRREISGNDTTYSLQRFPLSGTEACGIVLTSFDVPPGTVAWVHTQPWKLGEKQLSCGPIVPGTPFYANYNGEASDDDNDVSLKFGENMVPPLPDGLPGYVLDADGINKFGAAKVPGIRFSRCSY